MNVSLPPGMKDVELPRRATDGIPFGAGRPVRVDKQTLHVLAKCEVARDQEACPGRGRPTVFRDADELMHSCVEYMEWINANPLFEKQQKFSGTTCKFYEADLPKKRPFTVGGLCLYLGIATPTWDDYRRDERFKSTTVIIDEAIRNQKLEGAASGFFNPAIIARDLGLVDKQEVTGANGGPIEKITTTMSPAEAAEMYARTREGVAS